MRVDYNTVTGVLIRRGKSEWGEGRWRKPHKDRDAQGRIPCENGGRDENVYKLRDTRNASNSQKLGERHQNRPSLSLQQEPTLVPP